MSILILFGVMVLYLVLGAPVAFSILLASMAYLIVVGNFPMMIIVERVTTGIDSFPLLAIPFFILAAQLMNTSGISQRIFNFALSLVGHIKGGLGHVNVLASIIFSGMSGSAAADTAGLGAIELKAMRDEGYDPAFAAAITVASSTIGPIIPPSIFLVLYGVTAGVSVGRLFIAGIIPGLLMGLSLMLIIYYLAATKKVDCPARPKASLKDIWYSFKRAFFPLMAPVIILGGIFHGAVTPTEAGVLAVLYALILGFMYGELNRNNFYGIILQSVLSTGMLMFIVASTYIFSWAVTIERLGYIFYDLVSAISTSPIIILLIINLILLFLGLFIEGVAVLIIMVPVLLPIIKTIGIDPVQFGVVLIINLMIGFITPPVGVGLYVVMDIAKTSFAKVVRAVFPFILPLIVVLLLVTYVPQLTLWLPSLFFGR